MKKAFAVIGSGYGDEGKGLIVDFLARQHKEINETFETVLVARGNGGAQAGHTVVTEDGNRHVFGHIASGFFAGAATYLAENFIINPYALMLEREKLKRTGPLIIHSNCKTTTNFDMMLNALRELARGKDRHGSCGMGINETVTRHLAGHEIFASYLQEDRPSAPAWLARKLEKIHAEWWQPQVKEIVKNCSEVTSEMAYIIDAFNSPNFIEEADFLIKQMKYVSMTSRCNSNEFKTLIVEGAQGLALDEHLGEFPYVTRSNTGLMSAIKAAAELNHKEITPIYVMRAYSTRHGAGPLAFDNHAVASNEIIDETNKPNKWQETLRFAPLNIPLIANLIREDLERSKHMAEFFNVKINTPEIAITCMDQVDDKVNVVRQHPTSIKFTKGARQRSDVLNYIGQVNKDDLRFFVEQAINNEFYWGVQSPIKVKYMSWGPTASSVQKI